MQALEASVARAMAPFLPKQSGAFARELVAFVSSGRSLRDWDAEALRDERRALLEREELQEAAGDPLAWLGEELDREA